ncbi:ligand-binding SRPBCC domain-containing protein [Paenibacillus mucilaginosus]|uniref:SRPBCC family protein n=1 Tax=Paenibacillus mucilaginosus TaxID=61624 RepID=UPI003D211C52
MIICSTEIEIQVPVELCFDAARSIDLHTQTVWKHTRERAVAGRTAGLIESGETVTFQARHFLVTQKLTSRVIEFERPHRFVDEMITGAFKSMRHEHTFSQIGPGTTMMRDTLVFAAPLGVLGWIVERVILKKYMLSFLKYRNQQLKAAIEREGDLIVS